MNPQPAPHLSHNDHKQRTGSFPVLTGQNKWRRTVPPLGIQQAFARTISAQSAIRNRPLNQSLCLKLPVRIER